MANQPQTGKQTRQAFVVAVSGASGAGKSALVRCLVGLLEDVVQLSFDDYIYLGNDPHVIQAWLAGGAQPDALQTPQLASDLRKLSAGQPVHLPHNRGILEPAEFILLEEPFGRARHEIAPLITLAAHLEPPPDVALARRILRAMEAPERPEPERLLQEIAYDLQTYLIAGRVAYRAAAHAARVALAGTTARAGACAICRARIRACIWTSSSGAWIVGAAAK